jgi:hypothetical protein
MNPSGSRVLHATQYLLHKSLENQTQDRQTRRARMPRTPRCRSDLIDCQAEPTNQIPTKPKEGKWAVR